MPPATFIPLAEEAGLIGDLGRSVLQQACSWIGGWQQTRPDEPLFYVSVNISARQLQRPEFTGEVEAALVGGGARGSLVLEITESLLMQDTEATLARLHDLSSSVSGSLSTTSERDTRRSAICAASRSTC